MIVWNQARQAEYQRELVAANRAMQAYYGFGVPTALPSYRDAEYGEWQVSRRAADYAASYLAQTALEPPHHVLARDQTTWMAASNLECESHAWHIHQARGTVVCAGLGMGLFAALAAAKPNVGQVVVIEMDPDVIEVCRRALQTAQCPGWHKVSIVQGDATSIMAAQRVIEVLQGRAVDYLYADIWPDYPNPDAPGQTRAMVDMYQPRHAGWWGQELALALDCLDGDRPLDVETALDYYARQGVPVPVTPGYAAFCRDVARVADIELAAAPGVGVNAPR